MTKTILITGATDGIGLLTAKKLAADGHKVLIHGRSEQKLESAKADIENATGAAVSSFKADLSSLTETRALASQVIQHGAKLDILINNAGVLKTADPILSNGQDIRFVVNTLAPYVLTQELLTHIPSQGRIINLSSAAQAPVDIDALLGGKNLDDMTAYSQSKLAIVIWSQQMAADLPNGPTIISVNPGSLLASKMVKEGFGIAGNDLNIGADILCRLSLGDEFSNASGRYWDNDAGSFNAPHPAAKNTNHALEVMRTIEQLTKK